MLLLSAFHRRRFLPGNWATIVGSAARTPSSSGCYSSGTGPPARTPCLRPRCHLSTKMTMRWVTLRHWTIVSLMRFSCEIETISTTMAATGQWTRRP
ncbi:hypothetical protein DFH08DRAFT_858540 [Mycena albidolilacea]|uniref:Uncharacterized protein n=1 Tax=Mycena albidolilacea TaxID=1033008 RepID=A0AAD7EUR4_9AGAR|nr:hypothetical protein DFH08DRAFT_858540 [Mycena albidolilacea]